MPATQARLDPEEEAVIQLEEISDSLKTIIEQNQALLEAIQKPRPTDQLASTISWWLGFITLVLVLGAIAKWLHLG